MRPSFRHTNKEPKELENTTNSPTSTSNTSAKALHMAIKKKETEEELTARLKSYSYLQKQAADESWISLSPGDISPNYAHGVPIETVYLDEAQLKESYGIVK